jgi:hypothetical protein
MATIKGEAAISAQSKQRMLKDELARTLWDRQADECAVAGGR